MSVGINEEIPIVETTETNEVVEAAGINNIKEILTEASEISKTSTKNKKIKSDNIGIQESESIDNIELENVKVCLEDGEFLEIDLDKMLSVLSKKD